jgi:glycine cleavage system H lipoate-binding protein
MKIPYHDGWMIEVKLTDEAELDELTSADEYDAAVSTEKA